MKKLYIMTLVNKPELFEEARQSILDQTVFDQIEHIWKIDDKEIKDKYRPAVYFNQTVQLIPEDAYFIWLSDDDLWMPECAENFINFLNNHPEVMAVYCKAKHVAYNTRMREEKFIRYLPENNFGKVFDEKLSPYCRLDGGQVCCRKSVLKYIKYPYVDEQLETGRVCDGLFLEKVAKAVGIYPLSNEEILIKFRATEFSSNTKASDFGL